MFATTDIEFNLSNEEYTVAVQSLPVNFDWSKISPDDSLDLRHKKSLISKPTNQFKCGSCWAISVAACISDAYVIAGMTFNPDISTTYALINYPQHGCNGGNPLKLLNDIKKAGIASKKCIDYRWCSTNPRCNGSGMDHWNAKADLNKLIPSPELTKSCDVLYFIEDVSLILADDDTVVAQKQDMVKNHILTYGPVVAGYIVFNNFIDGSFTKVSANRGIYFEKYSNGIWSTLNTTADTFKGGHAVAVVGWGVEPQPISIEGIPVSNVPFWICRNSWGTQWGNDGYFKIAMYPYNKKSQFIQYVSMWKDGRIQRLGGVLTLKVNQTTVPRTTTEVTIQSSSFDEDDFILIGGCLVYIIYYFFF